jgi:hypothetical protein
MIDVALGGFSNFAHQSVAIWNCVLLMSVSFFEKLKLCIDI